MMQYLLRGGSRAWALAGLVGAVLAAVAVHPAPAAAEHPAPAAAEHPAPAAAEHAVHPAHPTAPATGKPPTPGPGDTSACTSPALSQAFLWAGDRNLYTLVGGQAPDSFKGTGWTLSGGARVVSTRLRGGQTGSVLDLPSGARAVSPAICVTSNDPAARAMVRNVSGGQGIAFYISYQGSRTWLRPQKTGQFHGRHRNWTPSTRINLLPSHRTAGWQIARFVLVGGGKQSDFQVYDFYVDPRMKA